MKKSKKGCHHIQKRKRCFSPDSPRAVPRIPSQSLDLILDLGFCSFSIIFRASSSGSD